MSPIARRDHEPLKGGTPAPDPKTPLRLFRNTFKGNQMPMAVVMGIVLLGLVAYLAPGSRGASAPDSVVARVYGRDVLALDVQKALEGIMRQMGNQQNVQSMLPFLQQEAMRRTVDLKLFEELAERHSIMLTDQEVKAGLEAKLRQHEVFVVNGKLRPTSEIHSILQNSNMSLLQWEKEVRDQLMIQKLMEHAASEVPVDEAWINQEYRIQSETISYEFASLSPSTAEVTDPGDGTLEPYLKGSGTRFQFGPRRVLQYVAVDQSSFGDSIQVDDTALQAAYESKKAEYSETDTSHILFRAQTDTEVAAATKKAEELRAKLVAGGDFGKAAAELSQDPTTKTKKGRLGWFRAGAMVKPFEDGAQGLKVGEISQPVKTNFGIHLIKLEGRRVKPFEEVKEVLRTQMMGDRFATQAKDRLEQLRKRVGGKGDLAAAAKTLKLPVSTSLPLLNDPGTTIEGLPGASLMVENAFQMAVGEVSKVQDVGGRFVVFRVQEEKPIAVPPLLEIRKKVLDAWKLEEARKRAAEKAKAALDSKDLALLGAVSTKENATIASLGSLGQHPAFRKALLETPVDAFTPVLWSPEGQVWLARVKARTAAEPLTFEKRASIIQSLQASSAQERLEAERKELDVKGRRRSGFSSLRGRFGGIWTNPESPFANQPLDLEE